MADISNVNILYGHRPCTFLLLNVFFDIVRFHSGQSEYLHKMDPVGTKNMLKILKSIFGLRFFSKISLFLDFFRFDYSFKNLLAGSLVGSFIDFRMQSFFEVSFLWPKHWYHGHGPIFSPFMVPTRHRPTCQSHGGGGGGSLKHPKMVGNKKLKINISSLLCAHNELTF